MKFLFLTLGIILFSITASQAAPMKEKLIVGLAGGSLCKIYAEEVSSKGDAEAFGEMNTLQLKMAEKLGYTNDFDSFVSNVRQARALLKDMLFKQYGSKQNIYSNWCVPLYNGYQKGVSDGSMALPSVSEAVLFESVIDAMAINVSASHTNNSWEDVSKIKGVKWAWPYYESGAHDSQMLGKTQVGGDKNPNIGEARVIVSGSRTMIDSVNINIYNLSANIRSFGKGKITKIKTSCDNNSVLETFEFYKLEKLGYKPLYISYISSWGASGDTGGVYFKVSYRKNNALKVYKNPCKVLD